MIRNLLAKDSLTPFASRARLTTRLCGLCAGFVLLNTFNSPTRAEPVTCPATSPASPISYDLETRENPPLRLHVVTVDLTDPNVRVVVRPGGDDPDGPDGPWATTLMTVRQIAGRDGLDVAINGGPFMTQQPADPKDRGLPYVAGNWARPSGRTMVDGNLWAETFGGNHASLVVDQQGKVQILTSRQRPPVGAKQIVSGFNQIVLNKKNIVRGGPNDLAPRTAVGVDFASTKLFLVVVDGRRVETSDGMTDFDVAEEMLRLGAHNAVILDGGGSSTLVLRDAVTGQLNVTNTPSDGSQFFIPFSAERPVANVLGIRITKNPESQK